MQPIAPWMPAYSTSPERQRGFLLSGFLLMSMLGNTILAAALVLMAGAFEGFAHTDDGLNPGADFAARTAHHLMLFVALLAVCNLACLTGAWMWKKWGVYGYGMISGLAMLVGMRIAPASALMSIVWGAVVASLVAAKWRHFE
jgi:peptidoglycan/LPS O-acetylase OafA/YrhL